MQIQLLAKGAELLNDKFKEFNKKHGTNLRTDFKEDEFVDSAYASVLMGIEIEPIKTKNMKANELMIGDWVHFTDLEDCEDKDIQWTAEDYIEINIDYCNPIQLTEEILKVNGIPTNGDTFCFEDDKDYRLELCFIDGVLSWTINCAEYIILKFKYVHELQHALRLCGLNELADNFIVTKGLFL